jgi:4'-phosphopantetheinyl transferase EntD
MLPLTIKFTNKYTQSFFTCEKYELPLDKLGLHSNHQFSPKRLSDFSTGRYCAKMALEQLDIKDVIIPIGKDREPIWPEGIVGSISHCDSLTGAIVAKKTDHISLGLDIEEIGRVTPDLWDLLFTENEKKYLSGLSDEESLLQSTVIFAVKEAFYKFQHPLTNTFLDFLEVEVVLPDLNHVCIFADSIDINSVIRKNHLSFFLEKETVVALVTNTIFMEI